MAVISMALGPKAIAKLDDRQLRALETTGWEAILRASREHPEADIFDERVREFVTERIHEAAEQLTEG